MKNNVSQVAASDAASQSTMLNFECEILQKRMEIMVLKTSWIEI